MLKKRLMGVITVKDGWAVQSFGYQRYLPLGKLECLVENLDRWGADEILVQVIDRSGQGLGPDFGLLERLGCMGLETPLIYAGGISSVSDGVRAIQLGADRIAIDGLLHDDILSVKLLSERLGAQALIASMPLAVQGGVMTWYDYRFRVSAPLSEEVLGLIDSGIISEVLLVDWLNEGSVGAFDQDIIGQFPLQDVPFIVFGGLGLEGQMAAMLEKPNVVAIGVGNFLNYREHAIQMIKEKLVGKRLRLPGYESKWSILNNV